MEEGDEDRHPTEAGKHKEIVIERFGEPPIRFSGEMVAHGSTMTEKKDDRGFVVRIFCSPTKCVGHVEYVTKWKSEANASTVYIEDSARALAGKLLAHDPMTYVVGYPPGERFDEKRHRLELTIRRQYTALVSRLLVDVPGAAEEERPPDPNYRDNWEGGE